ncbi:MAG: hypothetical protein DHS20C18_30260 [Saprospiraceae bacterium]|nr:MAG: hypothetical protein DHS20C18_30260 [Saprospiraceae bacterium]
MSTNSSSPSPNPQQGPVTTPNKSNQQRNTAIAAVVIVALLGLCTFLVVRNYQLGNTNTSLAANFDESEQLKAELEKQYYEALSELEEMRGSNEELNALIESQKVELKAQKEKIEGLLRNKSSLDKARKELAGLNAKVEQYLAEINQLREENEMLSSSNTQLTERNQNLTGALDSQLMTNASLSSEKAMLVSEKESLESERARLSKKVNIASVIKVEELDVNGLKSRKSGKAVKKKFAKNVEQLNICFNTTSNVVAEEGTEIFYVRIINPLGETLAIDNLGSGVFTNNATGEDVRYTKAKEVEYDQKEGNVCLDWTPGQAFAKGTYDVEIYNKGYLAGSTSITLK